MRLKKLKMLFAPLFLLLCVETTLFASASDVVDREETGSVSVTLKDGDTAVSGAEITLYQVAAAETENSGLQFVFTEDFRGFGGTPTDLTEETVSRLADYAVQNSVGGEALRTDENGSVRFEGLSLGLYLAVQSGSVPGYSDCSPFLVSVPTKSDGNWIYDIDATPKTDIVRLVDITVKKLWNDDGENRPESITVELRNGDAVVDTVTLKEQNGWSHTWENQPKGDAWSVKEIHIPKGYTATYAQNGFEYTITNTPTLIQTGQLKWPVPVLAGAGLLLFAIGWVLYFKGESKKHA